jgi:hypothetical protein
MRQGLGDFTFRSFNVFTSIQVSIDGFPRIYKSAWLSAALTKVRDNEVNMLLQNVL